QRLVLLRRANGDTQELLNARLAKVTHDHALLAQSGGKPAGIVPRMAGEDEVGGRRQHLKAQRLHRRDDLFTTSDYLLASLLEICTILECRGGTGNGDAIQRVGVEAVLDPLQRLDQL